MSTPSRSVLRGGTAPASHYSKSGNSQRFSNAEKGTTNAGKSHSRRLNKWPRYRCQECFLAFIKPPGMVSGVFPGAW